MAFFDHVTHWAKIVTWLHMWGTWKSLEDGELDLANLTDYRDVSLMSSFLQSFHFQHPFNNLWAFLRIIPMNTMPDSKQACWCYPCTLCPVLPHKGSHRAAQHPVPTTLCLLQRRRYGACSSDLGRGVSFLSSKTSLLHHARFLPSLKHLKEMQKGYFQDAFKHVWRNF